MKSNFSTKFKVFDVFVLIFAVVSIVASIVATNIIYHSNKNQQTYVRINYHGVFLEDKEISFNDVDGEVEIVLLKDEYPNLLGDLKILVNSEKGICISEVTCPNHTCEKFGWIKMPNYPITCLPNGVYVMLVSQSKTPDDILG